MSTLGVKKRIIIIALFQNASDKEAVPFLDWAEDLTPATAAELPAAVLAGISSFGRLSKAAQRVGKRIPSCCKTEAGMPAENPTRSKELGTSTRWLDLAAREVGKASLLLNQGT